MVRGEYLLRVQHGCGRLEKGEMSRIGNKPVDMAEGVAATAQAGTISVKGALGELSIVLPGALRGAVDGGKVCLTRADDSKKTRSLHGLFRNLVANMVEGVSKGFSKELEIQGVGFKASVTGQKLTLFLGFSCPVEYTIPDGVKVAVTGGTAIVVSGVDKQKVGNTAARIRSFFLAEPYKGKGIRFKGEHVRRKVGKTVA